MTWRPLEGFGKKGIYGGKGKQTSHACVTYDEKGTAYSGGANAAIHAWRNRSLIKTYKVHTGGFVGAIKVFDGKVFSGGKDGYVVVSDPNSGDAERSIEVGSLIRAIDWKDGNIIVGDRDGRISEINSDDEITTLMYSHSDGETWGLDITTDGRIVTTGDDNKIMVWSIDEHRLLGQENVYDSDEHSQIGKASTLSKFTPSKCARAVAVNQGAGADVSILINLVVV
jgi:WD40 repeat protein